MEYSNVQDNNLSKTCIDDDKVTLKKNSICSTGKQDIIFKKLNYRNIVHSRLFLVSILFLLFFFFQDINKFQDDIKSGIQFKNINSRKLAELDLKNYNDDFHDTSEGVPHERVLSKWKDFRDKQRSTLNDEIKKCLDDLFEKSEIHDLSEKERKELWDQFLKEFFSTLADTDGTNYQEIYDLCREGLCSREDFNNFLNKNFTLWNSIKDDLKRKWDDFLSTNIKLLKDQVKLVSYNTIEN
ncbi:Plasmodium exported protein (PHIST), unknown function [Plasmodium gallinaceum]|uniref:Plasmodium RESA N-terminal domain-containing protein n=1 Tax=Plasmodium gallinaceum TaxID=5849 RepID=A0A1J1GNL4_PLAGA|nr:Plasmodium exported protein (PHIST), unknown function [Plasmodium gallinaceum]CRG94065.1 Plasmodium exported protein (PHIST), unknown function [Plasmodium gallinaceum]